MRTGKARFTRAARLTSSGDYKHVFQQPFRSSDDSLTVLGRLNPLDHPRLGLAISKKRVKLATARNRIKRVTRECFRLQQHKLPNLDIIVIARNNLEHRTSDEIRQSLNRHWKRLIKQCKER